MSKQQTLNSFFTVRKKPADQHAAKRRKVIIEDSKARSSPTSSVKSMEEPKMTVVKPVTRSRKEVGVDKPTFKAAENELIESVVTSVLDDHLAAKKPLTGTPKDSAKKPLNTRQRKRDAQGQSFNKDKESSQEKVLFTVGRKSVRKQLQLPPQTNDESKEALPIPDSSENTKSIKINQDSSKVKGAADRILANLECTSKLNPQEVKEKLAKVSKLSDLQAKLRALNSSSPALTTAASKSKPCKPLSTGPALAQDPKTNEAITVAKPTPIVDAQNLSQPDKQLPIPQKYKLLAEVFEAMDQVAAMKHNRCEVISLENLRRPIQSITRRNLSDDHIKQVRRVFPEAYSFTWERIRDRMGRDTNNFELHLAINISQDDVKDQKKLQKKLSPAEQLLRTKIFKHNLLKIVEDHHRTFLKSLGITLDGPVRAWHKSFNIEGLPDVDPLDFPPKPFVDKITSAQEMLQRLGPGVNPRLENVLKQRAEASEQSPVVKTEPPSTKSDVKIVKGLQGLPPHLLELLKAKERAKQVKTMMQSSETEKELEMLQDLVQLAPVIVNCHRSQCNSAAVPAETLFKVTSASQGKKSPKEMEQMIRLFMKLVPECLESRSYDKIEYIKLRRPCPDINIVREKLEKIITERKK